MQPYRRRLPPDALEGGSPRAGVGRLWLLVAGAPIFALAPIVGCAVGGKVRQSALPATAGIAPPALAAPVVSLGEGAATSVVPPTTPTDAPLALPVAAPGSVPGR